MLPRTDHAAATGEDGAWVISPGYVRARSSRGAIEDLRGCTRAGASSSGCESSSASPVSRNGSESGGSLGGGGVFGGGKGGGGRDLGGNKRMRSWSPRTVNASSAIMEGALVLTTHRALFVEDARGHGEAGELVEMPLAFIVETEVKRIKEGLVRLQVRFCGAKTFQDKPGRAFDATFFLLVS